MTKAKNTKRALVSSILSLIVCVSMLIGSTFAWFTDSVTSGNNKIVAGTLEVDLLMADENGNYDSIAGENAAIFGEGSLAQDNAQQTLWEPGKTQIVYLAVENKGNLDLKYNIALNVVDGGLIGSLEYAIVDGAQYGALDTYTDWATLKANAQTGDVVAGTTVAAPNGAITVAEKTEYFALAVHMKEEADNKYQGKDITIDVTVLATQLASESDSFNNQYDKDAEFAVNVDTADELKKALGAGGNVILTDDIAIDNVISVPAGVTTNLDLNGKTVSNPNSYAFDNKGTLTIEGDGVIEGKSRAIKNAGTLTLNGGAYKGSSGALSNSGSLWGENVIIDGDVYDSNFDRPVTVVGGDIKNCNFESATIKGGNFTGCTFGNNAAIEGGTFDFEPSANISTNGKFNVVDNGDGTWTVVPDYEAYVGDTGYFYLGDAINAVADGEVIVVAKNIDYTDGIDIWGGSFTIDLNGKTITMSTGTYTNGSLFELNGTCNVTIKNGTVIAPNGAVSVAANSTSTATYTLEDVN